MSILIETIKKGCEYIQDIPPVNPKRGMTWKDTSFNPAKVKVYTGSQWIEVTRKNIPLTADFAADDTTVVINQSIHFTDNSIGAEDIIAWQWDFGDGSTSTDQNPTHQYSSNGQYNISLTVTDTTNKKSVKTRSNYITVANDPGANFIANFTAQHVNTNIQFTDKSTSNGTITHWYWEFGDGTDSNHQNPLHAYSSSGLYTVSLTVGDEFGSDTMTRTNYIAIDMPPTAEFVSNIQSAYIHDNIQFTDQSTSYGTITSWQWDFGDGTTSIAQNPVHSYSATGNYTVSLTVTDEFGNDTETKTNYIVISAHGTGYEYGYSMGGYNGSANLSTIDRITFPFDSGTAAHVGNLSGSRNKLTGCNSSNYGYTMSGWNGSANLSSIGRITFPFDSGTATHVGNLSGARYNPAGCNSSNYGYTMGGAYYNGSNWMCYSIIDRITFPFDSGTATHVGNFNINFRCVLNGCNSSNYGYSMGGWNDDGLKNLSSIGRITFPFDSGTAIYVGNLSEFKHWVTSFNSANYGYCIGGTNLNNSYYYYSTIDRITFPFDSGTAAHVGNLSGSRNKLTGCNSSNYGYTMSGWNGSANLSSIGRITFPFDSGIATYVGNLSESKSGAAGCDGTDFVTLFV